MWSCACFGQQDPAAYQYEDPASNIEQISRLAGISPLLSELKELKGKRDNESVLRSLIVRQGILERVESASLQVDATIARIDGEVAQANEYRSILSERRDKRTNRWNLLGIAAGGAGGVASSALQLSPEHAATGNSVGIVGGAAAAVFSLLSARAQNGTREPFSFRSNMLAPLLNEPVESVDVYSPLTLGFLNQVPEVDPAHVSRKQRLLITWQQVGRLDDLTSPTGRKKVEVLTAFGTRVPPQGIDDLYDRRAMLEDLRAKIALVKRDLAALLLQVTSPEAEVK